MNVHAASCLALLSTCLLPGSAAGDDDWLDDVPAAASMVRLSPADGATVTQTPPDFHWPAPREDLSYTITLVYPDGKSRQETLTHNWINWPQALPAGDYRWRVDVSANGDRAEGRERRFTVANDAGEFVVPDMNVVLQRTVDKERPRSLPSTLRQRMLATRGKGLRLLQKRVRRAFPADLLQRPESVDGQQAAALLNEEVRRTREALFAAAAGRKKSDLAIAIRRLQNMLSWKPNAASSYASNDQAARGVAATLVIAYDWLYDELDPEMRKRMLENLRQRLLQMHRDLFTDGERLSRFPYDSHRNHTLSVYSVICLLLAGDLDIAANMARQSLPMALHWTSPWGGEDGSFANGSAYALWVNSDLLLTWNTLREVAGIDLGKKAWVRNFSRFLAYFLPPGAPAGTFGDGAERDLAEQRARTARALALFAPSPLGRWYAGQLAGADYSRLQLLLAPPGQPGRVPFPEGTENAALFADAGWVAMHSDLADPGRTSVYFKSSPYGSFNHGHADQNSFVIRQGDARLAIDSGYYDAYGSSHWKHWYKQTRAHNAITYDGGQGQPVFELSRDLAPGRISRFEHRRRYDIASGDARRSYGDDVAVATRTLVYLRPDLIFVHDRMRSTKPRHWEWNLHAMEKFEQRKAGREWRTTTQGETLCVRRLAGPDTRFSQNDEFDARPAGDARPAQWHARLTATRASRDFELLMLLAPGCPEVDTTSSDTGDGVSINVRGVSVGFGDTATVRLPD